MENGFNDSLITLISKVPNPFKFLIFILSPYMVLFIKIVTKVIANQIKKFLPYVIDHNQTSFLPVEILWTIV